MCDMFLILKAVYFTSYAGHNNTYAVAYNFKGRIRSFGEVGENPIGFTAIK